MWPGRHGLPQVPQFCGSLRRFLQIPLQSVCPDGQAQNPFWQVMPPVHTLPQKPQLAGLLLRFTHALPHCVNPTSHCQLHIPPVQVAVELGGPEQTCPHAPQLARSLLRFTHALPHCVKPGLQENPHWECSALVVQVRVEFGGPVGQALPHPPQLSGSFQISAQFPAQQVSKPPMTKGLQHVPPQEQLPVQQHSPGGQHV
jgi:hypothetical protein